MHLKNSKMKALLKDDLSSILSLSYGFSVLYFWEAFQSITMIGCSVLY
jgi:hypothetical protein